MKNSFSNFSNKSCIGYVLSLLKDPMQYCIAFLPCRWWCYDVMVSLGDGLVNTAFLAVYKIYLRNLKTKRNENEKRVLKKRCSLSESHGKTWIPTVSRIASKQLLYYQIHNQAKQMRQTQATIQQANPHNCRNPTTVHYVTDPTAQCDVLFVILHIIVIECVKCNIGN